MKKKKSVDSSVLVSLSSAQSDAFGAQPKRVSWSCSVVQKKSQWLIKELKLAAFSAVSTWKKQKKE